MKACSRCGVEKADDEFCIARGQRTNRCKACHAEVTRAWRAKDPAKAAVSSKAWQKANPERVKATKRQYEMDHPDKKAQWRQKFDAENPEKRAAHRAVSREIRAGRMVRPEHCSECGQAGRIEAHHEDYSKHLEVVWLCKPCHTIADANRASRLAVS